MISVLLAAPTGAAFAAEPAASAREAAAMEERPEATQPESPPKHRGGIVLGLAVGGGIGRGAGYPNNTNDIGKLYHQSSAWMPGTGESLLVMGALADYLDFGFWFASARFRDAAQQATQTGLGLRVELFPLLGWCPHISGLALFSQFGLGTGRLSTPGFPQAGGTQSFIGAGVFYEWAFAHFLGGHFGAGPSVEYDAVFSRPYGQNDVVASVRVVFYGAP